ncbi:MAG: amino acid permease [SAR324 cluster bacterium]|nr:amino acid permease [SAR324 cluster bacterium]
MAQLKKYGVFSGVFTPSILTILGVIMYLRMPWLTGQAGLYMMIGIILIAHIVSITTGLSVSSIATDKKVEGGGSYYIISRSLGLSIGGTLGIALFVGLSFSVSLYVIGFCESFNSFWGFENSINNIRLTGSLTLLLVAILTFISTSLAMKSQFFILATIALSLLSVFLGSSAHIPEKISLFPQEAAPSMMILFGIFFPAVTGFEAGVSMSGDLQNPKKSIPMGTIIAILVGMVVYLGLPVFLLSRVEPQVLVSNPNILLEISLFPPLVIAGIWSATISSAIGSILGAPRILQATSVDGITPKFFAKGHGKGNEPRNALLLTFLIAEGGILIGELDIIARIVSIFFLTAYGFLNISCAVESWASSDFRPSFRIPKLVGIVGFLACFLIMIELDLMAMFGGIIVMGGLLFYLKSRELKLKSGDVWESVWLSVIRKGLFQLSQSKPQQRNWKPNILLFSGGTVIRPHLIEFSKWSVGQQGIVSNFDLIENTSAKMLFPKAQQSIISEDDQFEGVFIRRQECQDIYEGINTIVRTYGFSGIEPNTVLMGWRKNTKHTDRFFQLLENLKELDFNMLLLNYHDERGFGNHKTIDIWWRGAGNNGNFTLALVKFILASIPWRDARLRFLVVTNESIFTETIHKNMQRILQEARLESDIKVINNAAENLSFAEIIALESNSTDLTILGLPEISVKESQTILDNTNQIMESLGTTLLVHASSFFSDVVTGIEYKSRIFKTELPADALEKLSPQKLEFPPLTLPGDEQLSLHLANFDRSGVDMILQTVEQQFLAMHDRNRTLIKTLGDLVINAFEDHEAMLKEGNDPRGKRSMAKIQGDLFFQFNRLITEFKQNHLVLQKDLLEEALGRLCSNFKQWQDLPDYLTVLYPLEAFQNKPKDRTTLRWFKWRKRLQSLITKKQPAVKVPFQQLVQAAWGHHGWEKWRDSLHQLGIQHFFWIQETQRLFKTVKDRLESLEYSLLEGQLVLENVQEEREKATSAIQEIQQINDKIFFELSRYLLWDLRQVSEEVVQESESVDVKFYHKKHLKYQQAGKRAKLQIDEFPQTWWNNQTMLFEMMLMDLMLMTFQRRISIILQKIKQEWFLNLENEILNKIDSLLKEIQEELTPSEDTPVKKRKLQFDAKSNLISEEAVQYIAQEIQPALEQVPESVRAITDASLHQLQERKFHEIEGIEVSLRELLEYLIHADLLEPLRHYLSELQPRIETIIDHVKDAVRFLSFNILPADINNESLVENDRQSSITQTLHRIEQERDAAEKLQQELMQTIDENLKITNEKINPYLIIQSSNELRRYIRKKESKKVISFVESKRRTLHTWMQHFVIRFLYHYHQGILKTQEHENMTPEETNVAKMLLWMDRVTPDTEVLNNLSFHYKQLFLSNQPPTKDFWVGRQQELTRADLVLQRFNKGTSGALMITGERFSGKSALSHYIANHYFKHKSVFQIIPPAAGSCNLEVFHQSLETIFKLKGNSNDLFRQLPSNSVIIFQDIELWWERHPAGNSVIKHLESLIRAYGQHFFFILEMNTHAFKLIKNLQNFEEYFLDVIECGPMIVEELKNLILLRHKASGLTFTFDNDPEDLLSELQLTRLFLRIFDYSKGNPGAALQAWVRHIGSIQTNTLRMTSLSVPDLAPLSQLPREWVVVMVQFILHKTLNTQKIMYLMGWDDQQFIRFIDIFKRAGILQEKSDDLWSLNPYLEPFLTRQFTTMGIL